MRKRNRISSAKTAEIDSIINFEGIYLPECPSKMNPNVFLAKNIG
jgi:hypothetical protein